jgi:tetratricopeptide (TPR) repeat protein
MAHPTKYLLLASCAWLVSCATTGPAPDSASRVDLDSHLLLAEVARERQRFDEAAEHYLAAALISDQPTLAELAAEIAQQLDLTELGLRAAERWQELRPGDPRVHQFLGVFRLRNGDSSGAVGEFEALIAGAEEPLAALALSIEILAGERDVAGATAVVAELVTNHPGTAEGHYGLARLALRNGDFELALENAERAVDINPEWVEAQLLYARTLLIAGRTEDGLRLAEQFAAEETDLEVRLQYAELLLSAGHGGEARALLDDILAENPGLPEAVRALAFLTLTENELDAAREYFNELRAEPRYRDEAFYYLGRIAESEEQTLQAMRFYSRVTQGNNAVEAQLRAANLLYNSMGDQEGALQHLREFGIANPDYRTEMLVAQGEILLQMNRTEAAQELLREALEAAPGDETLHQANIQLYVVLAQRAIEESDLGESQRIVNDALDEYPGDTSLRYAQALLYQEQGRLRRAVSALESLVSEQPDDAGLLNALGYLLTDELDRHEEARGYIQRALAGEPDNPAIIDSMGWVLFNLGEYEAALEYLERAYRLFPDPEVAAHIVDTQWALGNADQALELLRRSLEEHPDSPHLQELDQRLAP